MWRNGHLRIKKQSSWKGIPKMSVWDNESATIDLAIEFKRRFVRLESSEILPEPITSKVNKKRIFELAMSI